MTIIELNMLTLFNWGTPHYLSFVLIIIGYVKTCAHSFYQEASKYYSTPRYTTSSNNTWQKDPSEKVLRLKWTYHIHLLHWLWNTVNAGKLWGVTHFHLDQSCHHFSSVDQFQLESSQTNCFATESASLFQPNLLPCNTFTYIG